ncbi:MAG TPA: hypothetical protein VNU93_07740 [Verrucomicrobiae bacterium]|nr:hypothetical protein [Verrucomicrobiae bacterium]
MRQVRRKTVDSTARSYFLKAKDEGVNLSWNNYEDSLPQDGFNLIGLSCFDCLQGPCRLNPFGQNEARTICGLGKKDLVLNHLVRLGTANDWRQMGFSVMGKLKAKVESGELNGESLKDVAAKWQLEVENPSQIISGLKQKLAGFGHTKPINKFQAPEEALADLKRLAAQTADYLALVNDLAGALDSEGITNVRELGLGTLNPEAVNVCLQGVSPAVLAYAAELSAELRQQAIDLGAIDGFNIVLAGDFSQFHAFATVGNHASVEFALLTGLVDLYLVGNEVAGCGKNVAEKYHTVIAGGAPEREALRELFLQAMQAFTKRDQAKVRPEVQYMEAEFAVGPDVIKVKLSEGTTKGICIIGGGSNVKVTSDQAAQEIVNELKGQDIVCLTYGNSAVTLAKYGYLAAQSEQAVYSLGSEAQAAQLVQYIRGYKDSKIVAVFPELSSAWDFQVALALAEAGAKVFTGVKLPIDGSETVSKAMAEIAHCEPKALPDRVREYFRL